MSGLRMIERDVSDDNFAHTVSLIGACLARVEVFKIGDEITHDDINLIHIPAEIALAFVKDHIKDQTALGDAARSAIQMLETFRKARGS